MKREDDFNTRRESVKHLTDEELRTRFWSLAKELTDPMLQMGREYTTPSIERSVLLRMGFSSLEARALAETCLDHGLLGHGAGHVVLKMSQAWGTGLRDAGTRLLKGEGWEEAAHLFSEGARNE